MNVEGYKLVSTMIRSFRLHRVCIPLGKLHTQRFSIASGTSLAQSISVASCLRHFSSEPSPNSIHKNFSFDGLNGNGAIEPVNVANSVVLLVNTASYCGYTPQLKSLQKLSEKYADKPLKIIAVPSNDFGAQEPDNEDKISDFYRKHNGVQYFVSSKQKVVGDGAHPVYSSIAELFGEAGTPQWNFQKYLLNADGEIVGIFEPSLDPLDETLTKVIDYELSQVKEPITDLE